METKEYRFIDKSDWDRGPWDNEPDKVQWQDVATGLPCIVRRGTGGFWCGYVGVAEGHPFYGRQYEENDIDEILRCHGGLTYSDFCQAGDPEHGICHVPGPGEPDHVWWFGFDCGHAFDLSPATMATLKELDLPKSPLYLDDVYRTLDYVKAQCASLAQQLAAVPTVPTNE